MKSMSNIMASESKSNPNELLTYLRIRPLNEQELERQPSNFSTILSINKSNNVLHAQYPEVSAYYRRDMCNTENFEFTYIFDEHNDQKDVFVKMVVPCMEQIVNSRSVLIFAYGITNSGKSYTMRGDDISPGMIPQFASLLFSVISKCRVIYPNRVPVTINFPVEINFEKIINYRKALSSKTGFKPIKTISTFLQDPDQFADGLFFGQFGEDDETFAHTLREICDMSDEFDACGVWCTYIEVYNNLVFDLLSNRRRAVVIGEDDKGYPFVKDLTRIPVFSSAELMHLFDVGRLKLQMAHTQLNTSSSRSHSIFSITIITESRHQEKMAIRNIEFCDLAGSERCQRSGATGRNLVESCKINSSLSALHRCIDCLRPKSKSRNFIKPSYRESKLTRLFQPYFEGFGSVRMIANISQDFECFDENLSALRFTALAQQVKTIQRNVVFFTKPSKNVLSDNTNKTDNSTSEDVIENELDISDLHGYKLMSKKDLIEELIILQKANKAARDHCDRILNDWSTQLEETARDHEEEIKSLEKAWEKSLNNRIIQVEEEMRMIYRKQISRLKAKIACLERSKTIIHANEGSSRSNDEHHE